MNWNRETRTASSPDPYGVFVGVGMALYGVASALETLKVKEPYKLVATGGVAGVLGYLAGRYLTNTTVR